MVLPPRCLHWMALLAALAGSALLPGPVMATPFEPRSFRNEIDERRYKAMVEELRCLVCQNQTIAASDADLAKDLRDRVYAMIDAGRSDQEIVDYMVQRYGEFVLYRPPLSINTILLWAGPFALGVVALGMLIRRVRRADRAHGRDDRPLSAQQREDAMKLLEDRE